MFFAEDPYCNVSGSSFDVMHKRMHPMGNKTQLAFKHLLCGTNISKEIGKNVFARFMYIFTIHENEKKKRKCNLNLMKEKARGCSIRLKNVFVCKNILKI